MTNISIKPELKSYLSLLTDKQSNQKISLKQYNKEIAMAEKQIKKGKFITQEDLEKEVKGW